MKSIRNQRGQGLIEYLIIVALVGVATITVMRVVGQNVKAQFARVSNAIQGKSSKDVQLNQVSSSQYKNSDLGNFFNGSSRRASGNDDDSSDSND